MKRKNWIRLAWIAEVFSPALGLRFWAQIGIRDLYGGWSQEDLL